MSELESDTKVWGVTLFKNEGDIALHTILHMAEEGLDGIIIADNMSTDNTWDELLRVQDLLQGSTCQIELMKDTEPGHYHGRKITNLASIARAYGADWIVPFDADELWFSHSDRLAKTIRDTVEDIKILEFNLYNHFPTVIDPEGSNPFMTMEWRDKEKGALPKVAVKWQKDLEIHEGNHSARYKDLEPFQTFTSSDLEIRHFPYRTFKQFMRKGIDGAKAYAATDLSETHGAHWREYGLIYDRLGEDGLRKLYDRYFYHLAPVEEGLVHDPAPFRRWSHE